MTLAFIAPIIPLTIIHIFEMWTILYPQFTISAITWMAGIGKAFLVLIGLM